MRRYKRELQYLLQLIYFGRTTIHDSQLDAFLKVLEEFKLSGIQLPLRSKRMDQDIPRKSKSFLPDNELSENNGENHSVNGRKKMTRQCGGFVANVNDRGRFECEKCNASFS